MPRLLDGRSVFDPMNPNRAMVASGFLGNIRILWLASPRFTTRQMKELRCHEPQFDGGTTWARGNVNFDNSINLLDFNALANIGQSVA
jgi:hypothetical protein